MSENEDPYDKLNKDLEMYADEYTEPTSFWWPFVAGVFVGIIISTILIRFIA